ASCTRQHALAFELGDVTEDGHLVHTEMLSHLVERWAQAVQFPVTLDEIQNLSLAARERDIRHGDISSSHACTGAASTRASIWIDERRRRQMECVLPC